MQSCVIIPARYKSTRFPGKPLVPLLGKPMIIWVAELSAKAVGKSNHLSDLVVNKNQFLSELLKMLYINQK